MHYCQRAVLRMALRGLTLRACPPALCAQLMSSARAPDLGLSADTTRDDIEFVDIADCEDYTVGVFIVPKVLVHPFSLSLSLSRSLSLSLLSLLARAGHLLLQRGV